MSGQNPGIFSKDPSTCHNPCLLGRRRYNLQTWPCFEKSQSSAEEKKHFHEGAGGGIDHTPRGHQRFRLLLDRRRGNRACCHQTQSPLVSFGLRGQPTSGNLPGFRVPSHAHLEIDVPSTEQISERVVTSRACQDALKNASLWPLNPWEMKKDIRNWSPSRFRSSLGKGSVMLIQYSCKNWRGPFSHDIVMYSATKEIGASVKERGVPIVNLSCAALTLRSSPVGEELKVSLQSTIKCTICCRYQG
jgi:hypothetical protein